MDENEKFWDVNLKNKISVFQDEHKKVLELIYKDACDRRVVVDFKYSSLRTQAMKYTDIRNKIEQEISDAVLNVCLVDLEKNAFIIKALSNETKEYKYAIAPLGVEYLKKYAI